MSHIDRKQYLSPFTYGVTNQALSLGLYHSFWNTMQKQFFRTALLPDTSKPDDLISPMIIFPRPDDMESNFVQDDIDSIDKEDEEDPFSDPYYDDDTYGDLDYYDDDYRDPDFGDADDWDADDWGHDDDVVWGDVDSYYGMSPYCHRRVDFPHKGLSFIWTAHYSAICRNRDLDLCCQALLDKEVDYCE